MGVKGFHTIYCLYANTGASKELLSELKSGSTKASKRFLSGLKCKLGILAADSWGQTAPKRVNDHSHPIASMENGRWTLVSRTVTSTSWVDPNICHSQSFDYSLQHHFSELFSSFPLLFDVKVKPEPWMEAVAALHPSLPLCKLDLNRVQLKCTQLSFATLSFFPLSPFQTPNFVQSPPNSVWPHSKTPYTRLPRPTTLLSLLAQLARAPFLL